MLVQCLITGRAAKRGLEAPKLLHSSKGEDRVTMNLKQRAHLSLLEQQQTKKEQQPIGNKAREVTLIGLSSSQYSRFPIIKPVGRAISYPRFILASILDSYLGAAKVVNGRSRESLIRRRVRGVYRLDRGVKSEEERDFSRQSWHDCRGLWPTRRTSLDVVRVKSMSRGVPIHFVGKMARMKEGYRERDRKKSTEARADVVLCLPVSFAYQFLAFLPQRR